MKKLPLPASMRQSFAGCVLICSATAMVYPLLFWTFYPHVTVHRLAIQYLYSWVYANCIGSLLFAVVPRVWIWAYRLSVVRRWLMRAATVVIGTTVGDLIANTLLMGIVRGDYDFREEFVTSIKISLILSTATVSIIATVDTYKYRLQTSAMELKTKELERERALGVATQMRLASLQSRLHPHFLFNTINSISSLIHEDPERAEDMLTRMAALLRFSLESAQPGLVPLERELGIVRDYLEIEKARFGERLRYAISGEAGPGRGAVLVPPLSIQTLVENSVKYAVNARREGALIQIVLTPAKEACGVEVRDNGPGFQNLNLLPGHGLDNLEQRLGMLFGEGGHLRIRSTGMETSVGFSVPRRSGVRDDVRGAGEEDASATRVSG